MRVPHDNLLPTKTPRRAPRFWADVYMPLPQRVEAASDGFDLQEAYTAERHLLYVACTRARDRLLLTGGVWSLGRIFWRTWCHAVCCIELHQPGWLTHAASKPCQQKSPAVIGTSNQTYMQSSALPHICGPMDVPESRISDQPIPYQAVHHD